MYFNEKISSRIKRVYLGIAMGIAIWLVYTSYFVISNAVSTYTQMGSAEFVLIPITPILK